MIEFTQAEWKLIDHRLEVDECIAEVLEQFHNDDVLHICDLLRRRMTRDAFDFSESITIAVIDDAICGSTFFGSLDLAVDCGEVTPQQAAAYQRTADRIERKFRQAFGSDVSMPRY